MKRQRFGQAQCDNPCAQRAESTLRRRHSGETVASAPHGPDEGKNNLIRTLCRIGRDPAARWVAA